MPAARTIAILFFALATGCAGVKEAPPGVMAQTGLPVVEPSPVGPNQEGAISGDAEAAATAPPAPSSGSQGAARATPPAATAPAKVSASPAAIEQPRKKEESPAATRNPEPPLDVAGLTTRLRDTDAIGVFTKLALKNQVDDLMKQFRAHHQSGQPSVASLRQPYDMLVLKVLSVVQDKDPALARTISGSREAIWGILADREKFNKVA
jgi:hypothetical protein